ncbi:MAG TPA: c-type cytochrome [Azospira sp.]|nr:c-type cytochrome [Azospira sp.]
MSQQEDSSSKSIMYWSIAAAVLLMVLLVPLSKMGKGTAGGSSNDDADARIAPVAHVEMQAAAAASDGKPKDAQTIYGSVCVACHGSGAAGAPKAGDKAAWAPRIAQGKEALYKSALNGKNAMPPRGGMSSLSDAEVKATVDFLVSKAK